MKVDESEVGNNLLANLTRFGSHSATNHSTSCCHQPKGCFPSAESCPFYCRATLKGTLFQQHKPCKANVKGDNSHLLMLIKSLRCRIDFIINGRQEHLLTGVDHRPDSAIIDRRHHYCLAIFLQPDPDHKYWTRNCNQTSAKIDSDDK